MFHPHAARRTRQLAAAVVGLAFHAGAGAAWVVEPSALLEARYVDNVRLSPDFEDDAIVGEATVQAHLRNVTERSEVSVLGGVTYVSYSETEDLDDEDIEFLDLLAYRSGLRTGVGFEAAVRRDLLLRTAEFIPESFDAGGEGEELDGFGDDFGEIDEQQVPGQDTDLGAVEQQVRRTRVTANPYFEYAMTERSRIKIGYDYRMLQYDDVGEAIGLNDSDLHSATVQLSRDVTERDALDLSLRASRFQPDDAPEVDAYEATVGWVRRLTPRTRVGIELGARRAETEVTEDSGFLVRLRADRQMERGRIFAHVSRSLQPNAFGNIVNSDRAAFGFDRLLSERLRFRLTGRAFRIRSLDDDAVVNDRDRDYVQIGPELTWSLTQSIDVSTAYAYRWVDRRNDEGTAAAHSVSVSLSYRPPSRI